MAQKPRLLCFHEPWRGSAVLPFPSIRRGGSRGEDHQPGRGDRQRHHQDHTTEERHRFCNKKREQHRMRDRAGDAIPDLHAMGGDCSPAGLQSGLHLPPAPKGVVACDRLVTLNHPRIG